MKSEFSEINDIFNEFEFCNISKKKLSFKVFNEGMATYEIEADGYIHEVSVINEEMAFFPRMTIGELLEGTPFFVWHRVFDKDEMLGQKIFRIVDQEGYTEPNNN